jgi:hypothetical protein
MKQYFIPTAQPAVDQKRINDYFLTFLGEIKLPRLKLTSQKIIVRCPDDDSTSIPLIKNLHLRVFDCQLQAYLPQDPNLLPISGQTHPLFSRYGLKPVFRYQNSLVFFGRDRAGKIHLINRHLLEYLSVHPNTPKTKDFSVAVAKNMAVFIALVDRGLIPLNYYQYSKIINLSGFKLTDKTNQRFICFQLDESNQTFIQTGRELAAIPKKYLAVKINPDVDYQLVKNQLIPRLNVSVYLE